MGSRKDKPDKHIAASTGLWDGLRNVPKAKIDKKKGSFPVFNITVDNAHTFYAGESKVLVKSK